MQRRTSTSLKGAPLLASDFVDLVERWGLFCGDEGRSFGRCTLKVAHGKRCSSEEGREQGDAL